MQGYIPNWAIYFTTYEWSKKQYASLLSQFHSDRDLFVNFLSSITAGALSNTATAPIWTIRTRMMTQTRNDDYRNSFHAAKKIYQTEGLYALYRGVIPSMWGLVSPTTTTKRKQQFFFIRFTSVFNFHFMNI